MANSVKHCSECTKIDIWVYKYLQHFPEDNKPMASVRWNSFLLPIILCDYSQKFSSLFPFGRRIIRMLKSKKEKKLDEYIYYRI